MDYFGINRSHHSLRFHVLRRLVGVAQKSDLSRFHDAIPELVAGRALATKEAEVLLAFVNGVRAGSSEFYDSINANLVAIFNASTGLYVDESELFAPTMVESCALRHHKCISQQISHNLAFYFAKSNNSSVLTNFFALCDQEWSRQDDMTKSEFVAYYGSLLGALEGVVQANVPSVIVPSTFSFLSSLCSSEYLAAVHEQLAQLQESFHLDTASLLKSVAEISALYSQESGADLANVCRFSEGQLVQLSESQQFHIDVQSDQVGLLQSAMNAHFHVLEFAFTQNDSYYDTVFGCLSRTIADPDVRGGPLAATLGRLAAILSGSSYQRLVQNFEILTEYFLRLDANNAFRSARQFADVCKMNFVDESSRIKLLYTLINKLTPEECALHQASTGDQSVLEWVASLLSATVAIVGAFESSDFSGLAISTLDQKLGTISEEVDSLLIETWGRLVRFLTSPKLEEVLELLVHADQKKHLRGSVENTRITIASECSDSALYRDHLLDLIVLTGDPAKRDSVSSLFAPLAALLTHAPPNETFTKATASKFHNAWFNLAALGFTINSLASKDLRSLTVIATHTPPLILDDSADHVESSLQLNPILCRNVDSGVLKIQHNYLSSLLSQKLFHERDSARVIFLGAAALLEELRTHGGTVSKLPHYFADSDIGFGQGHAPITQLTHRLTAQYVANLGFCRERSLLNVAQNLRELLVLSCDRVEPVRYAATEMVSRIINTIPAALCQHDALYVLLDCITLLDESVKNAVEDEFSPKAVFIAPTSGVTLKVSDNLSVRERSLSEFERLARSWISKISALLSPDLRSKLYTYLGSSKNTGRGCKFALEILSQGDTDDRFFSQFLLLSYYDSQKEEESFESVVARLRTAKNAKELQEAFAVGAPIIHKGSPDAIVVARESVKAPFRIFTEDAISAGIIFWHHTIRHQDLIRPIVVDEVVEQSILTVSRNRGLFSRRLDEVQPLWSEMEYAPSDKTKLARHEANFKAHLGPHVRLLDGFLRSCMHNSVLLNNIYMLMFSRLTISWLEGLIAQGSLHSLARNLRLDIIAYATEQVNFLRSNQNSSPYNHKLVHRIERLIIRAGNSWYNQPVPQWPFGSDSRVQSRTLRLLGQFSAYLSHRAGPETELLKTLVALEFNKISVWSNPLGSNSLMSASPIQPSHIHTAWQVNPHFAVHIGKEWCSHESHSYELLEELVSDHILAVAGCPEALDVYVQNRLSHGSLSPLIIFWCQVSPIESINLLSPIYGRNKAVMQFALRSLESHPITKCFFYVPQIVQQLRHDESGMVAEYILEAAKFSKKFSHQIIWNIMANMYMDDDGMIPDPMKPQLDRVLSKMKEQFSEEENVFYETEFKFFSEVTGISGKLKPYIKKSKAEKKERIDEEMSKIEVPENVYLPSHPNGTVIDIDRTGGKPLQSHAKAPFLASFKIRLDVEEVDEDNIMNVGRKTKDVWQGAIFKVGDDCRQDVLALQVISVFQSIFYLCGLDVYVFPYKVTATAAGRGVIDVLPNSVSRDMLGREAVNGLDQWFQSKHGGPNSIEFQRARLNFVKSMAAYSVISYLIQFKDRHNGNIMYDDDGHVIHIDFGFCFDIVPGGVRFEAAPFKLTKEMVRVMGGSSSALPFKWFEKLCIQVFLASRVYADDICRVVIPMLESGLPCFKGQTIKRLRERFVLHKSEAEAAEYMRSLVSKSYESNFTKGYDEFQRITNGIPY